MEVAEYTRWMNGRSRERVCGEIVEVARSGLDSVTLREKLARCICRVVPAAAYGFAMLDPETLLLTSVVRDGVPDAAVPLLAYNEYAQDDFNKVADLARRRHPTGRLSTATDYELTKSLRYRTILEPLGWGDELRAVFVADTLSWGFICMHRERNDPLFTLADEHFLTRVVAHVARGLRKALMFGPAATRDCDELAPGVIELTESLEIASMNDAAAVLLDDLDVDEDRRTGKVPPAVYGVISQLHSLATDPFSPPPRLPVRGRSGRWLVLHASHLRGPETDMRTAVIIEPAQPLAIAPLITRAYGLSKRESEICLLVLRGLSTAQMSSRLHISRNTIQDHLKSIFRKAGVRSRRELVGQIFVEHPSPQAPSASIAIEASTRSRLGSSSAACGERR